MTPDQLNQIESAAKAAETAALRGSEHQGRSRILYKPEGMAPDQARPVAEVFCREWATFVGTVSPAVVLQMVAEIRKATSNQGKPS